MIARSTDRYELVQMLSRKGFIFEEGRRLTPFEDGTQELRLIRIVLQFLAELAHVDTQVFNMIGIGRIPYVRENGLVRQHSIGMRS